MAARQVLSYLKAVCWRAFDHSNIVTIHGAEQIGGQVGLWMELVRGRTLEQVLGQTGSFSTTEATRIGRDLCGAVSAVHSAGLLHRDIKAHNVMLADDGRVVLMDFGTGREVSDGAISDLAGTPLYVAPEVLWRQPASIQSDVYSLGVLVFHILSGTYPVEGRTVSDIRAAHRTGSRVRLRDARPDVPRTARQGRSRELSIPSQIDGFQLRPRSVPRSNASLRASAGGGCSTRNGGRLDPAGRNHRLGDAAARVTPGHAGHRGAAFRQQRVRTQQRRTRRWPHRRDPTQPRRDRRTRPAIVQFVVRLQEQAARRRRDRVAARG